MHHANICGKRIPENGAASADAQEWDHAGCVPESGRRPV